LGTGERNNPEEKDRYVVAKMRGARKAESSGVSTVEENKSGTARSAYSEKDPAEKPKRIYGPN